MFKVFGISNTGDFSVCGKNVDANIMFALVLDWLHARRARDKVCHPELVSGSELSAKHTSP